VRRRYDDWLTIGQVAERSGVATSALRFYEDRGLIESERTDGNQRRYRRAVLRRIALIRAGQKVGLSLGRIAGALDTLGGREVATAKDWERLSTEWKVELDERIQALQRLRDDLTGCIGCGCLSLETCAMVNPDDALASYGPGAHRLGI
jgi:MerR family transcriptional regulator, redox-sensitive transcriptional activator SoxR